MNMTVDVIIPVYRPDEKFNKLIKMLGMQTLLPSKILIANTVDQEDTCKKTEETVRVNLDNRDIPIEVHPINKPDYDHALTRQKMAGFSDSDAILFMTQDAVPKDRDLLKNLSDAIERGAGAAFARQEANEGAGITEKYTRLFNYGTESYERTAEDFSKFGIKTIFCSDTCMIYDRAVFEKLGGFDQKSMFAEDMTYAFKLLNNGGKLAYVAEASVFHSHDLTLKENFRRSRALGKNQAQHPEIYKKLSSEKEGMKYVKYIIKSLFKERKPLKIPYFLLSCGARYLGVLKGRQDK
ncbi:MAG: glycosyltransferase [Lachnospiraceae bacterium]|nr:glycosyltransferase [Lachnospiraceae bacterium]